MADKTYGLLLANIARDVDLRLNGRASDKTIGFVIMTFPLAQNGDVDAVMNAPKPAVTEAVGAWLKRVVESTSGGMTKQ